MKVFVCWICSFFLFSTAGFCQQFSWTGTWDTTFDKLYLVQDGKDVTGYYEHDSGKLSGSVNGNQLVGTWHESGNDTGQLRFVMSMDGKAFSGNWGEITGPLKSPWNGSRLTPLDEQSLAPRQSSQGVWEGSWVTTFNRMELTEHGNEVSGFYFEDNGRIHGTVQGNTLIGTWTESGNDTGTFEFVLSQDGQEF